MAGTPEAVWPLAHDLYAHEPVGKERRVGPCVRATAAGADRAHKDRGIFARLYVGESSSRWHRCFKKHDAPHGRALLEDLGPMPECLRLLMDRAYEGNETRQLVLDLGMIPVVPPKSNRLHPWDYDHALYKKRNEIERLFRRLKGFRRIFSRFEKLDVIFLAFLSFALIVEALRLV